MGALTPLAAFQGICLTLAAGIVVDTRREQTRWRYLLWAIAAAFAGMGIFANPISEHWPTVLPKMESFGASPVVWFITIAGVYVAVRPFWKGSMAAPAGPNTKTDLVAAVVGADDSAMKALNKRISATEGQLPLHETTMRRIEEEVTAKIETERSARLASFTGVAHRMSEERAAQEAWNEQTRDMLNSNDRHSRLRDDAIHLALKRMPDLVGWETTTREMGRLIHEITQKRYVTPIAHAESPPSPTGLIDQFCTLGSELASFRRAVTGIDVDDMPEGYAAAPAHEMAYFDWGDDWDRYRRAHFIYQQAQYHPILLDTIFRPLAENQNG